jgi:hypothetical protein
MLRAAPAAGQLAAARLFLLLATAVVPHKRGALA